MARRFFNLYSRKKLDKLHVFQLKGILYSLDRSSINGSKSNLIDKILEKQQPKHLLKKWGVRVGTFVLPIFVSILVENVLSIPITNKYSRNEISSVEKENQILISKNTSLNKEILDITTNHQLYNQRVRKEEMESKIERLVNDIGINYDMITKFKEVNFDSYKGTTDFMYGQFEYLGLQEALNIPLTHETKKKISNLIHALKLANHFSTTIANCPVCEGRNKNIDSYKRTLEEIDLRINDLYEATKHEVITL